MMSMITGLLICAFVYVIRAARSAPSEADLSEEEMDTGWNAKL
ncbi:hypothetical protein ACFQWB_08535 [Paenibacillus thermoaerophilus]|jgi:hypothetical protein|uniref:Tumour necrosis factor receptor superfamily member 19 n=1 Tax=Paenibacillus thermoaerophilus TaxID=1215385 RepID=A0ABW2V418_9BACL|nr:hypothetical protein [Paenibacillus thermoaerophilus]